MTGRFSILWLLLTVTTVFSCKTIRLSNYLSVYDDEMYVYHFVKDSSGIIHSYDDTVTCKMLVRKGVLANNFHQNHDIFYYESSRAIDTSTVDIFTSDIPWNQFTYCFWKGNLYMGDDIVRNHNPMYGDMVRTIPKKVKFNSVYTYHNGDYIKSYRFHGLEDIAYDTNVVRNTLKVSIGFDSREGFKTTDTIWLIKKFGVFKWSRPDGYVGQIKQVRL